MPWVLWFAMVVYNWLARILTWYHIMEYSQTISSARVSMIISELADSFVLGADVGVSMRSNGVDLEVVPVAVAV